MRLSTPAARVISVAVLTAAYGPAALLLLLLGAGLAPDLGRSNESWRFIYLMAGIIPLTLVASCSVLAPFSPEAIHRRLFRGAVAWFPFILAAWATYILLHRYIWLNR